jgi:hypothetical protein
MKPEEEITARDKPMPNETPGAEGQPSGNWFQDIYQLVWYVQLWIVMLLLALWVAAGMP